MRETMPISDYTSNPLQKRALPASRDHLLRNPKLKNQNQIKFLGTQLHETQINKTN
jgi:hypothetical protein